LRRLGRVLESAKYFWPSADELVVWIDRGRLATLPKGAKLMCGLADALQGFAESTVLLLDLPRYISRELWTDKTGELSLAAAVAR